MSEYNQYSDATKAVDNLIDNKENEITDIENEIYHLKKTRRLLDTEFKNRLNKKADYLG